MEVELDVDELPPIRTCAKGHRSTFSVAAADGSGAAICLTCLSTLLSDPSSLSHHVSYALSQLSVALLHNRQLLFCTCRPHLLVPPLVRALAATGDRADDRLARQAADVITDLCNAAADDHSYVVGEFVGRIADLLTSGCLLRQLYTLHCFGVLLSSHQNANPAAHIGDKFSLFSNLLDGLQLPSEEIRGEIFFVLYKMSLLQATPWDLIYDDSVADSSATGERLLHLSLEALLKSQSNDVRMNCVAFLLVLTKRGVFENFFVHDQNNIDVRETNDSVQSNETSLPTPLISLFADAIKGSLLSSNTEVQVGTLDLIFHFLSSDMSCFGQIQALLNENIADYVFEVLRLSGNNDILIVPCIQVLSLLANAVEIFKERLAIGFPTLLFVLHYVAEIPFHPVQSHVLKLIWTCILNSPGIMSISQAEEIAVTLTEIFRRHSTGELGMSPEAFTLACSTFVEILKSSSSFDIQKLSSPIKEASRNAISSCTKSHEYSDLLLYSLYLLKEALLYSREEYTNPNSHKTDIENSIIETCETYLLPWLQRVSFDGQHEEALLGVLEIFHIILLKGSDIKARKFADMLASSSWFSLSFGCLGLFPSDHMKSRVYLMLSSVIDKVLGTDFGQAIRDAYMYLPSDPLELIYLLGQKSLQDINLVSCQHAALIILYVSSLYGERLADENQMLASIEQYILINSNSFSCGITDSMMLTQLVNLYGFVRGAPYGYAIPYSPEAEKAVFHLIAEKEWDLLVMRIHPIALKWLFQQEEIMKPMSQQVLNFCKFYFSNKTQSCVYLDGIQLLDIQMIAGLVVSGDSYISSVLVSLLRQQIEEGREDDCICVLNVTAEVLSIFPNVSDQFCLCSIADAFRSLHHSVHSSEIFVSCSLLVFNVLYSASYRTLSQDDDWLAVTVEFLEYLNPKLASQSCSQEDNVILGIFCLILHHSTNKVLQEAAKAITLSSPLVSLMDSVVQTACSKGPALVEHDEETALGESLVFVLLLSFFSLESLHVIFEENMDWQDFLEFSNEVHSLSVLGIACHDLCRLIHFGSSLIKLIASQCLVELLARISDQRIHQNYDLKCSFRYLESIMSVTEGFLFYEDINVARNCSICFGTILCWEKLGLQEKKAIKETKWCRLVMEELAIALTAPGLASRSFTNQQKSAAHLAVSLLKLDQVPGWIKTLFNNSFISGIIKNISARNVTAEVVKLFRELMAKKYLSQEQVAALHHLFQICKKQVYKDSTNMQHVEENSGKVVTAHDDIGKICSMLIHIMLHKNLDCNDLQIEHKKLLDEIEIFFQESSRQ
ncbi:protein PUTATIVE RECOMBINATION INITIATION DEFECT 1 isoform X1 [Typha latifolia]|uniref:protein PUTATIVE RECOMBINATION INITIATION DEFECT 1 isoform X1 n=1 Tax=Typha latifolia TaxID=4733 RepID=UPI003C2F652C